MSTTPSDSPGEASDDRISDLAARWLARRDRGLSPEENAELQRWIAASPVHASELARLEAAWVQFDQARSAPELVMMAGELARATTSLPRARERARWRTLSVAAAASLLIASFAWWQNRTSDNRRATAKDQSYQVLASAARLVTFEDGSTAALRGDSEVRALFSAAERRVELVRGEAHFTVKSDASRPFIVNVGNTSVRAVGTAFNVRLQSARVEVLVTEGKVEIADLGPTAISAKEASALVIAGERAIVERPNSAPGASAATNVDVAPAPPAELEQTLAWQSTRLVFDRTPLEDAVDAFNRHDAGAVEVKLVIGDDVLRMRRMGGTFRATNKEGFVRLLEQSGEVRAEWRGKEIVLLPAR
jgi:transmembrane sensor